MTPQQMIEFDARREAVLRHQLKNNPNFRAMRRDRRVAFAAGVVRYVTAIGILLFLVKAFLISQNGVDGYTRVVAPLLVELPQGGLVAKAIAPDGYSILIANTFTDLITPNAQAAQQSLEGFERIGPGASSQ
ncbi:MAG: hypothetical protein JXQ79_03705 [Rhodobacteraceae bacterium]|nr:hypothetical protein [Paracoccaceae bacterium]